MRELLADVSGLKRSVGFRIPEGELTCVAGIGSRLWDRLFGPTAPGRAAPVSGVHRRAGTPRSRRRATCCSTSAPTGSTSASSWRGALMRAAGAAPHGGRRGPRLSLVRRARPARLRRRHREPGGQAGREAVDDRRRGPDVRRRQLRDRPEVPPRPRPPGTRCRSRSRSGRSAAPSSTTSSCPTRSSRRTRTSRSTRSSTRTASSGRSCASTCRSGGSARASSAPTSSATRAAPTVIEQMLTNMFVGNPPGNLRPHPRLLDER